jgi:hypothetical protein
MKALRKERYDRIYNPADFLHAIFAYFPNGNTPIFKANAIN